MSDRERECGGCTFFEPPYCHRMPPQRIAVGDGRPVAYWPEVDAWEWCGEFKPVMAAEEPE